MVQAIHAVFGDRTVGGQAVPPFPDGGGAQPDGVQPTGVTLIQQQVIGKVGAAGGGQAGGQQRRAHKAGLQLAVRRLQPVGQVPGGAGRVGRVAVLQSQQKPGLGGHGAATGRGEVFGPDVGQQVFGQSLVAGGVLRFAQNTGSPGGQQGAVPVLGIGHKGSVGAALSAVRAGAVQCQPVPVMEMPPPAVVVPVLRCDKVHPSGHQRVVARQQSPVAAVFIQRPGDHAGRVAPGGRAAVPPEAGHNVRHLAAAGRLLGSHIPQILGIEGGAVPQVTGRGGKHLGVAGPAQPLVPLGAVGGRIQEIVKLAPPGVGDQPVDQWVPGGQASRRRQLGMPQKCREVFGLEFRNSFHLYIPIAVVGKLRLQRMGLSVRDIDILGFCGAQIVPVEIALLQNFTELQPHRLPGRHTESQPEAAGDLLPDVQHRFPCRGVQNFLHRQFGAGRDRGGMPSTQPALGRLGPHRSHRRQGGQGVVPVLAVIDI